MAVTQAQVCCLICTHDVLGTWGASADITGNAQMPVLQPICYTSKNLPVYVLTALTIYIITNSHFDHGIFVPTFPWCLFIWEILPVLIMAFHKKYKCITDFTKKCHLNDRGIMLNSIKFVWHDSQVTYHSELWKRSLLSRLKVTGMECRAILSPRYPIMG